MANPGNVAFIDLRERSTTGISYIYDVRIVSYHQAGLLEGFAEFQYTVHEDLFEDSGCFVIKKDSPLENVSVLGPYGSILLHACDQNAVFCGEEEDKLKQINALIVSVSKIRNAENGMTLRAANMKGLVPGNRLYVSPSPSPSPPNSIEEIDLYRGAWVGNGDDDVVGTIKHACKIPEHASLSEQYYCLPDEIPTIRDCLAYKSRLDKKLGIIDMPLQNMLQNANNYGKNPSFCTPNAGPEGSPQRTHAINTYIEQEQETAGTVLLAEQHYDLLMSDMLAFMFAFTRYPSNNQKTLCRRSPTTATLLNYISDTSLNEARIKEIESRDETACEKSAGLRHLTIMECIAITRARGYQFKTVVLASTDDDDYRKYRGCNLNLRTVGEKEAIFVASQGNTTNWASKIGNSYPIEWSASSGWPGVMTAVCVRDLESGMCGSSTESRTELKTALKVAYQSLGYCNDTTATSAESSGSTSSGAPAPASPASPAPASPSPAGDDTTGYGGYSQQSEEDGWF
jgi:hypothetical protein